MGRKSLWKDIFISSGRKFSILQSYYQSNTRAWAKYTVVFHDGVGNIETNLPYSELRSWFRFALDEPIPDHVSSDKPSWELYPE